MSLSPKTKVWIFVTLGLSLAVFGLLMYIMFPRILQWQIGENLVLSPDAEPYEYWKEVPVPIYSKFYFFNITNAKDIEAYNAQPILQEVGPYTFREEREKVNITWHDNGTVSYSQVKRWFFEPDMTLGSLSDRITTVNVPMMAAANQLPKFDDFFGSILESLFHHVNSTIFITQPVGNLLFEGYHDKMLETIGQIGIQVPRMKFGWFYEKNNSHDGIYTIFTGKDDIEKYGYVDLWNGARKVAGRQEPCDTISGTAGDMWPPFKHSREDKLKLFVADICSSLGLSYMRDTRVNEIEAYRYWLDDTAFDNGRYVAENRCYCSKTCMPPGALDIEECQYGAPTSVSFPHYLYADPIYHQKFRGLFPDPERHRFIIDLEPQLGIPINVEAKLQINVAVPRVEDIGQLSSIKETIYYPIFWFSESASISVETAEKLKFVTKALPQYVTIGCFLSVIIGGLILILTLHFALRNRRNKPPKHMTYTAVKIVRQTHPAMSK